MSNEYFIRDNAPAMNRPLGDYDVATNALRDAQEQTEKIRDEIRRGFVDRVVVFVDMVGSTDFKVTYAAQPEKWLMRVSKFCDLVGKFIEDAKGNVVKYIGDEVMGVFDRPMMVADAMNFVGRIQTLQEALLEVTGEVTEVKISLDFGKVMLLEFDGHVEKDPQGTPVDRCARIAKFAAAGTVVSSAEFVANCAPVYRSSWNNVGTVELKGLGPTTVYQLGQPTIEVYETINVKVAEYNEIKSERDTLAEQKKDLIEKNVRLQEQIFALKGKSASEYARIDDKMASKDQDTAWLSILDDITSLAKLIEKTGEQRQYARALFLFPKNRGLEHNPENGKNVDISLIDDEYVSVYEDSPSVYFLNLNKPKNRLALAYVDSINSKLQNFEQVWGKRKGDDFDYTTRDSGFWKEHIGINVL